ncbi:uncharacterized protein BO96DRAFT_436559 [Aspergillus niger CBS 101883]|uniref:uncharacterized protein n=1 Tax=Aspergillus lacticoffeatus (strain CBS 101883) TaxID=1450533 RepID=UPI000D7EDB48|nr:uncharacterized protein BO96DRAFT_436559 [Aspergillus niger CBS 101883]PYH54075.1 hypothetical protein BO96DRAFT_436559 [Aspergillus niger CBS 101883]
MEEELSGLTRAVVRQQTDPLPNEGDRWSLTGCWNPTRVSRTREIGWEGRAEPWEVEVYPRSLHRTTDYTQLQFSHRLPRVSFFPVDPLYNMQRVANRVGFKPFCSLADRAQGRRLLEAQESFNSSHLRQRDGSHPTLHSTHSKRKSKFFIAALGVYNKPRQGQQRAGQACELRGSILPGLTGSMTVCRSPRHHRLFTDAASQPTFQRSPLCRIPYCGLARTRRSLIPHSGPWRVVRGAIGTSARGGSNNRRWLLLLVISIVRSRYFRRPAAMSPRLARRGGGI